MKHIEEVPWWICDKEDVNYCAYSDTDSIYIHAEPMLRFLNKDFDTMEEKDKDDALEELSLKYQDIITNSYDHLTKECFNVPTHRLEMKTECVIRSAYFRATRRYAQWITKSEGITKEKLDVKGLEFKKANFPPVLGDFFRQALIDVLKGAPESEIDGRLKEFKIQILNGDIPLTKLGNPTAVKTLNKYLARAAKPGEMFSTTMKGAPAAVKSAIIYNDLIKFWKLDKEHSSIVQGDKVKWIYCHTNPYRVEALAFLDFDMPDKIKEFLDKYADRQKVFDSILLNKLEGFYSDLGWTLNLNPYKDEFFNF